MQKYNTGTAKQIVERLKEEGYYLTESSLRTWVCMGIIPSARCGRKVYIYYPNVVRVLQEGIPEIETPEPVTNGIRQLY